MSSVKHKQSAKAEPKVVHPKATAAAANAAAPLNAWSKPLQSKKPSTPPPPGLVAPAGASNATTTMNDPATTNTSKPLMETYNNTNNNITPDMIALRERYLQTLLLSVGQSVTVTLKSGRVVEGVLHTASPFASLPPHQRNQYILKTTTTTSGSGDVGTTMVIAMKDVVQVHIKSLRFVDTPQQATSAAGAFTDTEISSAATAPPTTSPAASSRGSAKLLEAGAAWISSHTTTTTNARAEALMNGSPSAATNTAAASSSTSTTTTSATAGLKGSIGTWDQFHANETLFNVKSSFDENIYTTELDKSKLNDEQIRKAERIAREIESSVSTNMHIAEERNHALENDYDEEDRYSGVLKKAPPVVAAAPDEPLLEVIQESSSLAAAAAPSTTATAAAAPKMNYAAAAAKTAPPGFAKVKENKVRQEETTEREATQTEIFASNPQQDHAITKELESTEKPAEPDKPVVQDESKPLQEEVSSKPEGKEELKASSKLNANAKEFTFNASATTFTPTFAGPSMMHAPPPLQPQPYAFDPTTGLPFGMDPSMAQQQFMHMGPMGQQMMHMMQQYPGARYPGMYPGMDGQMPPVPQQPLPVPPPQPPGSVRSSSGAQSPMTPSEEGSSAPNPDGESSVTSVHQHQQSLAPPQFPQQMQQPMAQHMMSYPPNYYPMHPQQAPHQQQHQRYPPQAYGVVPQQMPMYAATRGPTYPMPPPPNMRPYYGMGGGGGPMPYQPYGYEDESGYRGRGNTGRGRGPGRAGGGGGGSSTPRGQGGAATGGRRVNTNNQGRGSGGRFYNNNASGRQTPQTPPPTLVDDSGGGGALAPMVTPAADDAVGESPPPAAMANKAVPSDAVPAATVATAPIPETPPE